MRLFEHLLIKTGIKRPQRANSQHFGAEIVPSTLELKLFPVILKILVSCQMLCKVYIKGFMDLSTLSFLETAQFRNGQFLALELPFR